MTKQSLEQDARDILQRLEHPRAQELTAGDVVELANILNERSLLRQLLREIVDSDRDSQWCSWCNEASDSDDSKHAPDCLLRRAREALARFA